MSLVTHTFTNPAAYLEQALPFFEAHESANSLILGVSMRLKEHPEWTEIAPYQALFTGDSLDPGGILLAALMTPPQRLLLSAAPQAVPAAVDAAIDALIQNLQTGHWPVPGVTAEQDLAQRFAARWGQLTGQPSRIAVRMRAYELRQVIPPATPPPGGLRLAAQTDLELVGNWHYAFMLESLHEGDPESSRKAASQRTSTGDVFLWDNGEPVSMAFRSRSTAHGSSISAVYTPPSLRGHGYASACVAELSQYILDSGKQYCGLFTDLDYPTSNSIYQKIGYYPICDFLEYDFGA